MDTIAFLTLFLGLALGPQEIKLSASDPVKRIVLRLDGNVAATMTAPPWVARVNLGPTLAPHRLTAVAFDAKGEQLAAVEQKINVPRATTEARIVVQHDRAGVPRKAKVVWSSVASSTATSLAVDLDGTPLQVAKDFTVTLPKLSDIPHVLRAKVVTANGDYGEAMTLVGTSLAAESESQLTGVAVEVLKPQAKRDTADLLRAGDKPLKVIAIDRVSAEVIFVRHPSEKEAAMRLDLSSRVNRRPSSGGDMNVAMITGVEDRSDVHLSPDDDLRFLWPTVSMGTGTMKAALFPSSRQVDTIDHGLRWWLSHISAPDAPNHRYADAVAVAGLQALGSRRARAVVLVVGEDYTDASALTPPAARAYLDQIGVPLLVWCIAEPAKMPAGVSAWGEIEDVSTAEKLRDATKRLNDLLARQQIVWAEGDFLPQEIALGPSAGDGIRLLAKAARAR